ncbi:MAG: monovalent cation/H+ antiporter complex subunit F [Phycisphaerales bacterium]|jgi:multicomponent Na+:H+ antiporter subunit F
MISLVPIENDPSHWLFVWVGMVFGLALLASVWRLMVGPTLPDRVVALDLIGFLAVGVICMFSIVTQRTELLGVALVAALILFLGTAAFAIYLDRRARP